ncbi:MAG TPA: hypothetical protein VF421_18750 [Niabella sp.]
MTKGVFILRAYAKGPENKGFSVGPVYYVGNNKLDTDFTAAVHYNSEHDAEKDIENINSERHFYLEIVKIYPKF